MQLSDKRCSWNIAGCSHFEHIGLCKGTNQSGLAIINCNCVAIPMTRWALESMLDMNIGDLKDYIHELCDLAALPKDFKEDTGKIVKTIIVEREAN